MEYLDEINIDIKAPRETIKSILQKEVEKLERKCGSQRCRIPEIMAFE